MIIHVLVVYLLSFWILLYSVKRKVFLIYAPLLSILFDTLVYYDGESFHLLRAVIFVLYIIYFYLFEKKNIKNSAYKTYNFLVILLLIYWIILSLFNIESIFTSIRISTINILPFLLSTCITFQLLNHKKLKDHLIRSSYYSLVVYVSFFFIANIFGLTSNLYDRTSDFTSGLADAHLYFPPLALFLLVIIKNNTAKDYILYLITFIVLLLSLRRTAIAIFPVSYLIYLFFVRVEFKKNIGFLIVASIIGVSTYPIYQPYLDKQLESRSYVFNEEYDINQEYRVYETILLFNDIFNNNSFTENVFGQHIFDSAGNYGGGILGKRVLHIDFNLILHGTGIFGLLLYLGVLYSLFMLIRSSRIILNRRVAYIFLFLIVFISFSGQMHMITFRLFLIQLITILSLYGKNINN